MSDDIAGQQAKVSIRDLRKDFVTSDSVFTALDGVTIDIPAGQFFVIVGPSGCGKTTLLRIVAGLEQGSAGTVRIAIGQQDRPQNSMVFQGDSIFPWMSVYDNAAYGLRMRLRPESEVREVVGHFLDKTGLTKF